MKLRFTIVAAFVLALSACGAEEGQKAAADVKAAAKPKKAPAAKGAPKAAANTQDGEDTYSPLSVPDDYRYEQGGRRDPFVNPVPKPPVAAPLIPTVRPPGLAGVLVGEAKITGIVTGATPGMTKAVLTVGKSTFFVVRGDQLFDGIVKEIRANEVVFTMISPATKQPVGDKTVPTGSSAGTSAGEKR
jgi:hypothetical protein